MEDRADRLMLEVSALGTSFAALEEAIEQRRPIVVIARKPSSDARALSGSVRPLLTRQDDRSDWQAMRDTWRLRHFAACFGMAEKGRYTWRRKETDGLVSVTFDPPRRS